MQIVPRQSSWYALQVRPRHEKAISAALREKGFEEFLPVYVSRRVWSDRIAKVELPLFPGYVFCRFDPALGQARVLTTPGVLGVVGIAGRGTPIDDRELKAVEAIVRSGEAAMPWPYLKIGNRVRIEHGVLAGTEGILVETKKQQRLIISISLLQRSVAVEIEREWVKPCGPRTRSRRQQGELGA